MASIRKIRIILLSVVGIALLAIASIVFFASRTSQQSLIIDSVGSDTIASIPINGNPLILDVAPGIQMKVDTGSDVSTITSEILAQLKEMGYEAKEEFYPLIGRDGMGYTHLYMKRYKLTMPFYRYECKRDTLGNVVRNNAGMPVYVQSAAEPAIIKDIDFVLTDSVPTLGIDFLEKFLVEYRSNEQIVAFYTKEPEGYERGAKLKVTGNPMLWCNLGHRYYVDATVAGKSNLYFIDTGLRNAFAKLPISETNVSESQLRHGKTASYLDTHEAVINDNAWIQLGNREGVETVYFFESTEEPYQINPLNTRELDLLLDFPGREFKFKI